MEELIEIRNQALRDVAEQLSGGGMVNVEKVDGNLRLVDATNRSINVDLDVENHTEYMRRKKEHAAESVDEQEKSIDTGEPTPDPDTAAIGQPLN